MVRFNDKAAIETLANNDILPITDMSDSSDDKKVTVEKLSKFTIDNVTSLSGGKMLTSVDFTQALKNNYDTAYSNMTTLSSLNDVGNGKLSSSNTYPTGFIAIPDAVAYAQLLEEYENENSVSKIDVITSTLSVSYKLAPSGSKIALVSQLTNVANVYNQLGYSDYYVLDTENNVFYLPRLDNPLTELVKLKHID